MKTLLIGIGNPGRRDDGLGPALVARLAGTQLPERAVEKIADGLAEAFWAYQLNIEDAAIAREYDRVIFADASVDTAGPAETGSWGARIQPLSPGASIAFTTHEMSPASVLALAEELYGKSPAGYLLKIRGIEWDFVEGLSEAGGQNLAEAERLFYDFVKIP